MTRDKKLGITLAAISLLAAIGAVFFYWMSGGRVPIIAFVWPALGFLTGVILFTTGFIEKELYLEDEIQQFPKLVEDDIEELRKGVFTPTHVVILTTAAAVTAEIALLLWYRKADAYWGPFNVLALSLIHI